MQDHVTVTGMIIKAVPMGEYDRRIVLLTKERGKISAFVKGARRQNSRFVASTNLFCFGTFRLYEGRTSYSLQDAEISNYFEDLRNDFEGAYYGMYFLEIADYYCRENNDEKEMLKLLYQSLRALLSSSIPHKLTRCIFEIKAVAVNGEFPGVPESDELLNATKYTISYILDSKTERLYTFAVTEEVLAQLDKFATTMAKKCMDGHFNSLSVLQTISG